MIQEIKTSKAPEAIGPYSQGLRAGDLLFISGQLPINPDSGSIVSTDPAEQAKQCLENLAEIARAAGTELGRTLKTTLILTDLADFAQVNVVYERYFSQPYPARACYQVSALPKGAKVEIEAIIAVVA